MTFADIDIPVSSFAGWMPGLIAFLFLLAMLLTIWNQGKKAFGRRPPIDESLDVLEKKLRSEIYHAKNSVKKELKEKHDAQEKEIAELRSLYLEMQTDRERKWAELQKEYRDLEVKIATLTERISNALKKLEAR